MKTTPYLSSFRRQVKHSPNSRLGVSIIGIIWVLCCITVAVFLWAKAGSIGAAVAAGSSSVEPISTTVGLHIKNIEDVKAGDRVWAYDAVNDRWKAEPVIKPLVHDYVGDMVSILVAGQTITSTGNHPYWVVSGDGLFDREQARDVYPSDRSSAIATGKGRWIEARKLQAGDELVLRDGSRCPISEVQVSYAKQKVYNLQVADLHTYAVSDVGVAVHNKPCFPPGTLILMGNGSFKPIERMELGDQVMAGDPLSTGPPHPARVTGIIRDFAAHLVDVKFTTASGGTASITSTRFHPFWTNNRGWVDAQDLKAGDVLQDNGRNSIIISRVTIRSHFGRSYNFEVAKVHTYYALADDHTAVLVHNQVVPPTSPGSLVGLSSPPASAPFYFNGNPTAVIGTAADVAPYSGINGYNTLNIQPTAEWDLALNDGWVANVMAQRQPVLLATEPNLNNMWRYNPDTNTSETRVFTRELDQFLEGGYRSNGNTLQPPPLSE